MTCYKATSGSENGLVKQLDVPKICFLLIEVLSISVDLKPSYCLKNSRSEFSTPTLNCDLKCRNQTIYSSEYKEYGGSTQRVQA